MIERNNCIVCGNNAFHIVCEYDMPITMACTKKPIVPNKSNMIFVCCNDCGAIQLLKLAKLDDVYPKEHLYSCAGYINKSEIWSNHLKSFSAFCDICNYKNVIEIGDPTGQLFSMMNKDSLESWTIYEKNGDLSVTKNEKLIYKNEWFDENTVLDKKYDTIVMSHILEHLYNPAQILNKLYDSLVDSGELLLSFPNMEYIAENRIMLPLHMSFEHTYYGSKVVIKNLLSMAGFKIIDMAYYKNHSIFIRAIKSDKSNVYEKDNNGKKYLKETMQKYEDKVKTINNIIKKEKNYYLYGAHYFSLYLIMLGLDLSNVSCILDNCQNKQYNYLYGHNIIVNAPNIIKNDINPLVICEVGIYNDEIIKNLKKINCSVRFI